MNLKQKILNLFRDQTQIITGQQGWQVPTPIPPNLPFTSLPVNSLNVTHEKISDTSYKFIVDIPVLGINDPCMRIDDPCKNALRYFPLLFKQVIFSMSDRTYHLRSILTEDQYNNWIYILSSSHRCHDLSIKFGINEIRFGNTVVPNDLLMIEENIRRGVTNYVHVFSVSQENETYYLDVKIQSSNDRNNINLDSFRMFFNDSYFCLINIEVSSKEQARQKEIVKNWEHIGDCLLELSDLSYQTKSSLEGRYYDFQLKGLNPKTEDILTRSKRIVTIDSSKFYLTDELVQYMTILKEAKGRILELVDCNILVEFNSNYLKVIIS